MEVDVESRIVGDGAELVLLPFILEVFELADVGMVLDPAVAATHHVHDHHAFVVEIFVGMLEILE